MLDAIAEPSNDATIQPERFAEITEELNDLFTDMWSDVSRDQSLPAMDVDYSIYVRLENAGVLRTFTVRLGGELIGAMVFFVTPNLHHRNSMWATCDVVWIRPDMRRPMVGLRLIRYAEAALQAEGVNVIRIGAKVRRPELARLLVYMGYDAVEISYQKVLT